MKPGMLDLPDEILYKIIKNIDILDFKSLFLSCKIFNQIINQYFENNILFIKSTIIFVKYLNEYYLPQEDKNIFIINYKYIASQVLYWIFDIFKRISKYEFNNLLNTPINEIFEVSIENIQYLYDIFLYSEIRVINDNIDIFIERFINDLSTFILYISNKFKYSNLIIIQQNINIDDFIFKILEPYYNKYNIITHNIGYKIKLSGTLSGYYEIIYNELNIQCIRYIIDVIKKINSLT